MRRTKLLGTRGDRHLQTAAPWNRNLKLVFAADYVYLNDQGDAGPWEPHQISGGRRPIMVPSKVADLCAAVLEGEMAGIGADAVIFRSDAANNIHRHRSTRGTRPEPDCSGAEHYSTGYTDTVVHRTESQSRLHHRVQLMTTSDQKPCGCGLF